MQYSEINELITCATEGDSAALEKVLLEVQDFIFNLSVRILGTIPDAEDAAQDILVKIMTNLSSFRKESNFRTWVYRIAVNYLLDYKKSMFAQRPLSFEYYADDIKAGYTDNIEDRLTQINEEALAEELKLSCTNVMLQCFDPQTRCIFILGTMFRLDSKIAGELLGLSPENYRQKLSRARRKMSDFLTAYCGLTETGVCCCKNRIGYAVKQHRLNPHKLEYRTLQRLDHTALIPVKESMEAIDDLSIVFKELPHFKSTNSIKQFIHSLLDSESMHTVQTCKGGDTV